MDLNGEKEKCQKRRNAKEGKNGIEGKAENHMYLSYLSKISPYWFIFRFQLTFFNEFLWAILSSSKEIFKNLWKLFNLWDTISYSD